MSIATQLQNIIDAKADIASAITTKGGTVPTLFEDYGDAIRAIPQSGIPVICGLNVTPTTSAQTITAPSGTDGYSPVNVSAVDSSIDSNIQAGNIKSGVSILGVTGTLSGGSATLSGLVVVPSTSAQTLTPTSGIDGFNQVNVNAVTSSIDQNISAGNIKSGVSILGVTGTYEGSGGGGGSDNLKKAVAYSQNSTSTPYSITAEDLSGLTGIRSYAFYGCTGMTSATFPNSGFTRIGDRAFQGCSNLQSVTIGNSVTNIDQYAFAGCTRLPSVTLGSAVTTVGNYAFSGDTGLTSVTFNDVVSNVSTSAFNGCTNISTVTIPSANTNFTQGTGCVVKNSNNALILTYGSVIAIPDTVTGTCPSFQNNKTITSFSTGNGITNIPQKCFSGCSNLQSVTIGTAVTRIQENAFRSCSSLGPTLTIPTTVITINGEAFSDCSGLETAHFDSQDGELGWGMFRNCTSLEYISLSDSITRIGFTASSYNTQTFNGCTSLQTIDFGTTRTTVPTLYNTNNFSGLPSGWEIWVPEDLVEDWKAANNWSTFADHIVAHPTT